jgi:hypothetical protein
MKQKITFEQRKITQQVLDRAEDRKHLSTPSHDSLSYRSRSFDWMPNKRRILMSRGTRHLTTSPLEALIAPASRARLPVEKHACAQTLVVSMCLRRKTQGSLKEK